MACHYIPLYNIITYNVTIMTLIAIMAINTLLCHIYDYFCRQSRHFLSKRMLEWATHLGYHVDGESQQLDRLVQWMTWTCGSWDLHTVFQTTSCVCDECPWHTVNQTRSCSGRIWSPMIWAAFSDRDSMFSVIREIEALLPPGPIVVYSERAGGSMRLHILHIQHIMHILPSWQSLHRRELLKQRAEGLSRSTCEIFAFATTKTLSVASANRLIQTVSNVCI